MPILIHTVQWKREELIKKIILCTMLVIQLPNKDYILQET